MRKLKVGKSKIAGKGLFTTGTFEQGEMIGLAHENDQPTTFIGKFHNHSDNPNAESVKLGDKRYLMAKRSLKKGEEITTNYRLQPELEQPEDFGKDNLPKAEYGMPMGGGMSQNYMGRRKFIHQDGGAYYDDSRDAWISADGKVGPNGPAYFQNGGGIYMELTDSEIEEFRRCGYIVEDLD